MWYVVHAAPHSEHRVCEYLGFLGLEAYAPQFPPPPRTKAGSVRDRRSRWVFPRYIFFRTHPEFDDWGRIRWAPGVHRLLESDGTPATIEDDVIEHLRYRIAERQLTSHRRWREGQAISIVRGPLRMLDAIFDQELDAPNRVRILVTLLGRQIRVEVDPATLSATG